jgi:predicted choloylglycine hydrolase
MTKSRVLSQQQQIDELRARVEALEALTEGWHSVKSASQILGVSPSFIHQRLKLRSYAKTHRRMGRNYQIHVGLFRKQLAREKS